MPKKGKKKGSKKGKKGKNTGPGPDASYEEWMTHLHEQRKAAGNYITNEIAVNDCIVKDGVKREWLLKVPPGGPQIVKDEKQYDKVKAKTALFRKVVIFYFAAFKNDFYNDQPFTPTLIELYETALAAGKKVEIVYVPMDVKQAQFEEFFETMPWLSLPLGDPQIAHLSTKYRVTTLPRCVVVAQDDRVVTDDGCKKMSTTPNQFPYVKALSLDPVEQAQRRPNPNMCILPGSKCKKFEGGTPAKLYETDLDRELGIKIPGICNGCECADIYHIPVKEEEDDKGKGKGGSKKKGKK